MPVPRVDSAASSLVLRTSDEVAASARFPAAPAARELCLLMGRGGSSLEATDAHVVVATAGMRGLGATVQSDATARCTRTVYSRDAGSCGLLLAFLSALNWGVAAAAFAAALSPCEAGACPGQGMMWMGAAYAAGGAVAAAAACWVSWRGRVAQLWFEGARSPVTFAPNAEQEDGDLAKLEAAVRGGGPPLGGLGALLADEETVFTNTAHNCTVEVTSLRVVVTTRARFGSCLYPAPAVAADRVEDVGQVAGGEVPVFGRHAPKAAAGCAAVGVGLLQAGPVLGIVAVFLGGLFLVAAVPLYVSRTYALLIYNHRLPNAPPLHVRVPRHHALRVEAELRAAVRAAAHQRGGAPAAPVGGVYGDASPAASPRAPQPPAARARAASRASLNIVEL
eukprot:TRINITY_DN8620_c0_g2_i2.p1 TRINITY_DN8620_c0_g2~~TRINITY_DN8620_c0_g2_i2.p1  ORF type:complete len:393 (+),score=96.01 TRINITY_DN8620_c0_g2_i2:85-1263(+)